jgi:hypothetical protein
VTGVRRAARAVWRGLDPGGPPQRGRADPSSGPAGRYGLLLLLLIATYLLSASGLSTVAAYLQFALFLGVVLLVLRTAQVSRGLARLVAAVAAIGSAAAAGVALTHTAAGDGAADIWKGLILLFTAVLIVRRVLARPTVTVQSIYGALSAYLIIGLMFAAYFGAIQHLGPGHFFADHEPVNTQTLQYFSFTTLTTLGYGDFTAAGNGGRALAVIEALAGQIFLATLVARLVAAFRVPGEQDRREARRRWPPANVSQRSRVTRVSRPARDDRPARRRR